MTEDIAQIAHLARIGLDLLYYLTIAWGLTVLATFIAVVAIILKDRRQRHRVEALQRHHALHTERRPHP